MSKAYTLTAVLIACNLSNNLRCNIAGCRKAVRLFNQRVTYNSTVLKHILKIYKVAIVHMLSKVVCIVKVNNALLVSLDNIRRQKHSLCKVTAYLACHIITLNAVYGRIFIRIFLFNLFIVAFNKR